MSDTGNPIDHPSQNTLDFVLTAFRHETSNNRHAFESLRSETVKAIDALTTQSVNSTDRIMAKVDSLGDKVERLTERIVHVEALKGRVERGEDRIDRLERDLVAQARVVAIEADVAKLQSDLLEQGRVWIADRVTQGRIVAVASGIASALTLVIGAIGWAITTFIRGK